MVRIEFLAAALLLIIAVAIITTATAQPVMIYGPPGLEAVNGSYVARIVVNGGGRYSVFNISAEEALLVYATLKPRGSGRLLLEPIGPIEPGSWTTLKPGRYRLLLVAKPGFSGTVTVSLRVKAAGPGYPVLIIVALLAAAAAASLSQERARDGLRRAVLRVASGLVFIIYRPEEALKHDLRAAIYETLKREGGASVSRLARELDVYANTVSWHLQVLERLGYVEHSRLGRWTIYYDKFSELEDWLSGFLARETRWGAYLGREELRRRIAENRQLIASLLRSRRLNSSKLRKILGV